MHYNNIFRYIHYADINMIKNNFMQVPCLYKSKCMFTTLEKNILYSLFHTEHPQMI